MFWIAATALTVLVVGLIVWPLVRSRNDAGPRAADYDIEVYRNQLKEVARERERGALSDADASAAEAEIGRRILAADTARRAEGTDRNPSRRTRGVAAAVVALVPIGATVLYLDIGNPTVPDRPLADRAEERRLTREAEPKLADAVEELAARLDADPDNLDGWMLLGRSYMQMQRYDEAVEAYARAVGLDAAAEGVQSAYGEALVYAAGGTVPDKAQAAFRAALAGGTREPRAEYYLAQAAYQAGDKRKALTMLVDLAQTASAQSPWLPMVRRAALGIAGEVGEDVADRLPTPARQPADNNAPALSDEQMEDMQDMPPEDRQAMIRGMVGGLASRLADNPTDLEGWRRLARSYTVLGEEEKALAAFDHILETGGADAQVLLEKARALRKFAGGRPTTASAALMGEVLTLDPGNVEALWFSALAAVRAKNSVQAKELFNKALAQLDEQSAEYTQLKGQMQSILDSMQDN